MVLEGSNCCDQKDDFQGPLSFMPNRVIPFSNICPLFPTRDGSPKLLHVNRQVRSEAGKSYFGRKRFELYINSRAAGHEVCAETEVQMWLKNVVGVFATHLRDVRVRLSHDTRFYNRYYATIRAKFDQTRGLQITMSTRSWNDDLDVLDRDILRHFFDMLAYVADLEEKRIARNHRGEIIVEFFGD
jgi:hypothetical protein